MVFHRLDTKWELANSVDGDLVASVGQLEDEMPADVPVAAEDENLHRMLPNR